jgi:hypothetical protein
VELFQPIEEDPERTTSTSALAGGLHSGEN